MQPMSLNHLKTHFIAHVRLTRHKISKFELPVKMWCRIENYKELRPICIWTAICHRQKAGSIMLQFKIFICNQIKTMNLTEIMKHASVQTIHNKPTCKLSSINTFSASSCTPIKDWSLEFLTINLEVKRRICSHQIK